MSNSLFNGQDVWRRDTESSKSWESQREDKDTLVILVTEEFHEAQYASGTNL